MNVIDTATDKPVVADVMFEIPSQHCYFGLRTTKQGVHIEVWERTYRDESGVEHVTRAWNKSIFLPFENMIGVLGALHVFLSRQGIKNDV